MSSPPNPAAEFREFAAEFATESDRAIVVLTAARLDYQLQRVLERYLVPSISKTDEFFESQGPASTFSNRIMLAYRLGLIDRLFAQSLNLIRRIRNDFAHEPTKCGLDHGGYRDRVRSLAAPYKVNPEFFEYFRKQFFEGVNQSRSDYMTVLGILIIRLEFLFVYLKPVSDSTAWEAFPASLKDFKEPNKAPEPTPTSVTSPAAQEPRQP